MRWTIAALVLAAAVTSAEAQSSMTNASNIGQRASASNDQANAANQAAKIKANEKAYNAALRNLPDRQYDPWHGVR